MPSILVSYSLGLKVPKPLWRPLFKKIFFRFNTTTEYGLPDIYHISFLLYMYYQLTFIQCVWKKNRETALQPQKKHREFTNIEVSIRPSTKVEYHTLWKTLKCNLWKTCTCKIILVLPEYYQKCTCNKTFKTWTSMNAIPDLGQAHETYDRIKLVKWISKTFSQWVIKGKKSKKTYAVIDKL